MKTAYSEIEKFYAANPLTTPPESPLDAFPENDRKLLREVARSFSVPEEIPIMDYLAVISTANGLAYVSKTPRGEMIRSNLWIGIIADSGLGKSATLDFFYNAWKESCAAEAEDGSTDSGAVNSHILNSLSQRGLFDRFNDDPHGITIVCGELTSLIADANRQKLKDALLDAYSGSPLVHDVHKTHIEISKPYLSVIGCTQPVMANRLFTVADLERGFASRFTFVEAELNGPRFLNPDEGEIDVASREHLYDVLGTLSDVQGERHATVEFQPDAYHSFVEWHNALAPESYRVRNSAYGGMLARVPERTLKLALILSVLDAVDLAVDEGKEHLEISPVITGETMRRAIYLGNWLLGKQRKVWEKHFHILPAPITVREAVISVILAKESEFVENDYRFPSDYFRQAVEPFLGRELNNADFRHFRKIGLVSANVGHTDSGVRGWAGSEELLRQFKNERGIAC